MALDWDAVVLAPAMAIFGGSNAGDILYWPVAAIGTTASLTLTDAVFDEGYSAVVMEDGHEISTVVPVLGVRQALFADHPGEPARNAQVQIPGKGLYVVREPRPDSHGHVLLLLNQLEPAT